MALNYSEQQLAFLKQLKQQLKSLNTLKSYKLDLDLFGKFLTTLVLPSAQENWDLQTVLGYKNYLEEMKLSENSKRRRIQSLRHFCDFLLQQGLLPDNPFKLLRPSPKIEPPLKPAELKHLQALWGLFRDEAKEPGLKGLMGKRNQVIFLLIYGSLAKVSDLTKMKVGQLFLDPPARVMFTPSERDPFTVPLLPGFEDLMADYLEQRAARVQGSNLLFFSANPFEILAQGISPRGIQILFEQSGHKIDATVTPKSLRLAGIYRLIEQQTPESLLKEWMNVAPHYSFENYRPELSAGPYLSADLQT